MCDSHFKIELFCPDPDDPEFHRFVHPIAKLYQDAYGSDLNWNEGKKCEFCTHGGRPLAFNLRTAPLACPTCGGALIDFWPINGVIAMLNHQLRLPYARCVVARDVNNNIVGCSWGFAMTPQDLEDHLNDGLGIGERVTGVAEGLSDLISDDGMVAYGKDMFVNSSQCYRRRGIGREMFIRRHQAFADAGLRGFVLRTLGNKNPANAAITYRWHHIQGGVPVIAHYPAPSERVIIAGELTRFLR